MAKKAEATVEHVSFSIDGEWLSEFCRTRVMEGAWENALKILTQDVSCTHEQAIKILKGEANLIGNSGDKDGIGWQDLNPNGKVAKAMAKQLDYLYGMVFKYSDTYYKPYAWVLGWDAEDMRWAGSYGGRKNYITEGGVERKQLGLMRSLYYANSPGKDLLISVKLGEMNDILCEETKMPPTWYDVPVNRPIEWLKELYAKKKLKLEQRGASGDGPYMGIADVRERAVDVIASRFIADLEGTTTMDEVRAVEEKYDDAFEGAYKDNRKAEEASMAARVVEQADKTGGWYELPLRSEELPDYNPPFVRVPKNAFLRWALRGFRFEDFGKTPPEWDNVAPSGWKMSMDDPYHTDWLLGAGIDLDEAYEHKYDWKTKNQNISLGEAAMKAAYNVKGDIVKDWTGVEFSFLARGDTDYVSGTIVHAKPNQKVAAGSIAIVPNAGPDYYITMMSACKPGEHDRQGAIICETGGKLAHLSITGREQKCTVLMVPGALKKYRDGDFLSIDLDSGKITLSLI